MTMWRMNGLWRRTAGVLVLCALLLSNEVMCQDPSATPVAPADADSSAVTDALDSAAAPVNTNAPSDSPDVGGQDAATAADPGFTMFTLPDGGAPGISGVTAAPGDVSVASADVVPDVRCVGEEDISANAVKAEVTTDNCEATKSIITETPAGWCANAESCVLKIFQNGKNLAMTSDSANVDALVKTLRGEHFKDKLGVTNIDAPASSSSRPNVFVGVLVSGLLAALGIIVGYLKCQRRSDVKEVKLAEEAYPVDQENQGNTLVSVAPLNPPPETPEKPSVNGGESPEAEKTQTPPPTNGHSTKTADTEL
ncbi:hypothetical protein E3U43_014036 [Larimichthys crocea]|uniref:Uncharacterized protein n=1 Tax=Larimichthys crocea TaxID=215358 RepID=A0ACD3RBL8_LARCR|nr:hypothetical protein E3U43_014036 [Larimichthys crocea]